MFTFFMAKNARVRTPYAPPLKKQAPTVGIIAFEALAIKYARYKGGTSQFLAVQLLGHIGEFIKQNGGFLAAVFFISELLTKTPNVDELTQFAFRSTTKRGKNNVFLFSTLCWERPFDVIQGGGVIVRHLMAINAQRVHICGMTNNVF